MNGWMLSTPQFHALFSQPLEVRSCGTAVRAQLLTFCLPAHITRLAMPCRLAFAGSDLFASRLLSEAPDAGVDRLMSLRPASKAAALERRPDLRRGYKRGAYSMLFMLLLNPFGIYLSVHLAAPLPFCMAASPSASPPVATFFCFFGLPMTQ